MVKSSFLKGSFISHKAGAKLSSMYTFVLNLAVSVKSEDISKFLKLQPNGICLAFCVNKRLTCLEEHPLIIGRELCRFVD